ncbi:methylated-DNA--[protein]-cysteine S-methyltransferase [Actinomycetospora chibensis]|uniref:Methylated-DNA--[protein]-cysteine S-methyltransferase n=1 Tax=Actinomycetospora chibensis TaxID=663606 RepID=A0ABV9RKU3_9PSEU|nr:methylated-DNA--[protein]-cysteine S-methyltransferase [Actinomycetospora chibensis]MDD7923415.1 methylated-DNA--[protein]-cysteine S-methyltransferase [Actinomycetospora chibensis]
MSALATVPTPLGPFTALVDADGAVLAAGWTDDADALLALVHPELRPAEPARRAELGDVTAAVAAYHDGDPEPATSTPVRQRGGAATSAIWEQLRAVPPGAPTTYGELAVAAGHPRGHRIAARACITNAATLFVPCHRVLRRGGALGGYRWGLELKERLLGLEASWRVDDAALSGV